MKYYLLIVLTLACVVIGVQLFLTLVGLPDLASTNPWRNEGTTLLALVGILLLVADVFIPMPTCLILMANGALFGWGPGSFLSWVGLMLASLLGYWVGGKDERLLKRFHSQRERQGSEELYQRYKSISITLSRMIPVLSESSAMLAGHLRLPFLTFCMASIPGCLALSLVCALAGHYGSELDSLVVVLILVHSVAGFFWLIGQWLAPSRLRLPKSAG